MKWKNKRKSRQNVSILQEYLYDINYGILKIHTLAKGIFLFENSKIKEQIPQKVIINAVSLSSYFFDLVYEILKP